MNNKTGFDRRVPIDSNLHQRLLLKPSLRGISRTRGQWKQGEEMAFKSNLKKYTVTMSGYCVARSFSVNVTVPRSYAHIDCSIICLSAK